MTKTLPTTLEGACEAGRGQAGSGCHCLSSHHDKPEVSSLFPSWFIISANYGIELVCLSALPAVPAAAVVSIPRELSWWWLAHSAKVAQHGKRQSEKQKENEDEILGTFYACCLLLFLTLLVIPICLPLCSSPLSLLLSCASLCPSFELSCFRFLV